jgi:membrane fusion protein, heavy metal efflux system
MGVERGLVAAMCVVTLCAVGCKGRASQDHAAPASSVKPKVPMSVVLSPAAIQSAGVVTADVTASTFTVYDEMPGTIEAPRDALVVVNARAAGVVDSLEADVGDKVKAGRPVAVLRSAQLAEAQANLRRSTAAQQHAAIALERSESLQKDGVISQRRLEDDRLKAQESKLAVAEAAEQIRILGGSSGDLRGTISVSSPISGTVVTRSVNRGEAVAENAPLYTVVDISKVVVQVRAPAGTRVAPGTEVPFTVENAPEKTFTSTVISTSDVIDPETRRFPIRCSVDNAEQLLKPGMFVTARMPHSDVSALTVPESAIQNMDGGDVVFVAHDGGKFERRAVTLGPRANGKVAVEKGLTAGEHVVVQGAFWLRSELQKSELEE